LTIITSEDVKEEKPAPDGFQLAAGRLQVESKECVVIEDAEKGILAAKHVGMKAQPFRMGVRMIIISIVQISYWNSILK